MTPSTNQKPRGKAPARQTTIEPKEEHGENNGENDEELINITIDPQVNTPSLLPVLPGFSKQQMHNMMDLFQNMLHTTLQQFLFSRDQTASATPLLIIEKSNPSLSKDSPSYTIPRPLRAEEMGYFDPKYQPKQGTLTNGSIVNANKYVYYRDVYIFIDRLKDLANQHLNIKSIMTSCFRDSALM